MHPGARLRGNDCGQERMPPWIPDSGHRKRRRRHEAGVGITRGAEDYPSHLPSAARPFSLARSYTTAWALAKLPTRSCDHSFSAACCMARP